MHVFRVLSVNEAEAVISMRPDDKSYPKLIG